MGKVQAQEPSEPFNGIAFVGEAPGEEEVRRGMPLVGPAGRVHNVILRNTNINRNACLTTNLFDTKAPGNDVTDWLRDPARLEDARARLARELDKWNPSVIVPLGASALYGLLGQRKIGTFRGSPVAAKYVAPGRKMVPALHPAAVMRTWKLLTLSISDYLRAAKEAKRGRSIKYPDVTLYLCPTAADVEEYLRGPCRESDLLSVDIETGWGCITMIGFAPNDSEAMCVPFVDLRRPDRSYWRTAAQETRVWRAVRQVLGDPTIPKLGQNFVYDIQWLRDYSVDTRGYEHDTRLLHHAFAPELPKDLATMGGLYSDLPQWKSWGQHRTKDNEKDDGV